MLAREVQRGGKLVVQAQRLALSKLPPWAALLHAGSNISAAWELRLEGAASRVTAQDATGKVGAGIATVLHGTTLSGLEELLIAATPYHQSARVAAAEEPGPTERLISGEGTTVEPLPSISGKLALFAARTEQEGDVRLAETYSSLAAGDRQLLQALLSSATNTTCDDDGSSTTSSRPYGSELDALTRYRCFFEAAADLTGTQFESDGPFVTNDGRVVFSDHDGDFGFEHVHHLTSVGFGGIEPSTHHGRRPPVSYFLDTGTAYAIPWTRMQLPTARGLLFRLDN